MVRFGERLKEVLRRQRWKQVELAHQSGVSPGNVSRWCRGETLPDRAAFAKVLGVVPEEDAPLLVAAWVADTLPEEARPMVKIEPKIMSSRLAETTTDGWPSELSGDARRKFMDFAKIATDYPDVMTIVNVLHTAALRLRKSK
jgi:transcriptional regulator with XRE-family HTH domain